MEKILEPEAMKKGDPRVIANGFPVRADFRIVSESNYQKMMQAYNEKYERWEKSTRKKPSALFHNIGNWLSDPFTIYCSGMITGAIIALLI